MTTGKTIALTRRTFVGKVMSLLLNMLSRLVITFLPRSKRLLISSAITAVTICSDFGAPKNKVWHCFHCFPIHFPWSDGTRCHDLSLTTNCYWWTNLQKELTFSFNLYTIATHLQGLTSASLSFIFNPQPQSRAYHKATFLRTSQAVQWLRPSSVDSILGWEAKIPHASWPKNQNINNRSNIVTNSIKTLKNVPYPPPPKKNWGVGGEATFHWL